MHLRPWATAGTLQSLQWRIEMHGLTVSGTFELFWLLRGLEEGMRFVLAIGIWSSAPVRIRCPRTTTSIYYSQPSISSSSNDQRSHHLMWTQSSRSSRRDHKQLFLESYIPCTPSQRCKTSEGGTATLLSASWCQNSTTTKQASTWALVIVRTGTNMHP